MSRLLTLQDDSGGFEPVGNAFKITGAVADIDDLKKDDSGGFEPVGNAFKITGAVADIDDLKKVIYDPIPFSHFYGWQLAISQNMGGRRTQEDRLAVCPCLGDWNNAFFGLWDGAVDDFAAEQVRKLLLPYLKASCGWAAYEASNAEEDLLLPLQECLREAIQKTDEEVINMCREAQNHYSSCTGVMTLWTGRILTAGEPQHGACTTSGGSPARKLHWDLRVSGIRVPWLVAGVDCGLRWVVGRVPSGDRRTRGLRCLETQWTGLKLWWKSPSAEGHDANEIW
eukprot:Skav213096  [mRNA]  locus=scaffold512:209332:218710:- [translate_table: standard]